MKRARSVKGVLAYVLLLCVGAGAAVAEVGPWQKTALVEARLVSAVSAAGDLDEIPLGVQVRLRPGWKTYWRSPGDAGLPPQLDWEASDNLASVQMSWPAPHRFTLFGIETFGYEREVVFPVTARPERRGEPVSLDARLDLLVCSDVCVPNTLQLSLRLPAGPAGPAPEANLINRYAAQVPADGRASGLAIERVAATTVAGKPALAVTATAREPFVAPDVFVETTPPISFAAPQFSFADNDHRASFTLPVSGKLPEEIGLANLQATLTLVDGRRSAEIAAVIAPGPQRAPGGAATTLVPILAIALLGGLLLNLMPCVLPVLSLKLLSVVGHGGASPAAVRAGFLASAAGILFSFLLLAGLLIGMKATGAAVGWGIQFQQPLFLVLMIVVLTAFATNLWGFLEIPLPRFVANLGGYGGNGPLAGHFLTGMLATLLATPCSAPFLGTAVGFALARGPVEIATVFVALGFGLALPYLLVAAAPRLATVLPRPGRWMVALRRILAVALALTAAWLGTVLAAQEGKAVALAVAFLMLAMIAVIAGRAVLPGKSRAAGGFAAVIIALAAFVAPSQFGPAARAFPAPSQETKWTAFDQAAIADLVAGGRTVLVDVTADWCVTCKANKLLVLERGRVAGRLGGDGVVGMRADWTRPDETIARYLAGFGRYGIPFNVVYGPQAPAGIVLSELLTEAAVLDAFDRASGGS
jgi:suppressor for copper-sensitivity B